MGTIKKLYDILIVEDNPEQASLTKMLMEEYGFKAHYVTKSTEAFKTIQSDKPDVVKIKSSPVLGNTKIIIYSGKMYDSDRRKALELGADAFFIKPARANMLITKIKELIHPIHNGTYQN
jgi:DNA-binding response OmpR family regulator